jgi:imidazolonepropionase-like amidohydrolase
MRVKLVLILSLAAAVPMALRSQSPAAGAATVFEGARVIVGDGNVVDNATIVVQGERVTQVGPKVATPAGATRVDLKGKTVMPAIIDTHVHTSQTREALLDDLRRRPPYGVSAVMSLGQDTGDAAFQLRDERPASAARIFTAGRGITMPEPGRTTAPYWITSPDEGRKAVGELAGRKVDIVKIWVDDRNGQFKKLTPDLYGAVIDEAHKRGLRVTAHLFTLDDAKGLLRAGIDAFAHGVRDRDVDEEFMAMLKPRPNLVLVPNLPDRGVRADLTWLKGRLPDGELQKLEASNTDRPEAQATFGIQARNLARMSKAGVRIAIGTDGNNPWAAHVEMADMVAAGMTPAQVIVAATRNGAEFLRITDAGTLATGKSADFIVLDANPLDDITNTRKISFVYLRGQRIQR